MPAVDLYFPNPPEATFRALSEPRRYGSWVVGSRRVEEADPDWPAPGSEFRHEQGIPPLTITDTTEVLEADPPRYIKLEARVRPILVAHIELRLTPHDGGTKVVMEERPVGGLAGPVLRLPPLHLLIKARNLESLRRLRRHSAAA
jgi:uncharacterized protein YndB with AHSA1/START domain